MKNTARFVLGATGGYALLQMLGRRAGSTHGERTGTMPGDEIIAKPSITTNHATTIDVPPTVVWPWLTQMGWHLGGWYTPGWVDRLLFPGNWPSLDGLDPALTRDLQPGDTIPDGPPATAYFVVREAEPPHALVLYSNTHLPPHWRQRLNVDLSWTWSLKLTALPRERTRLQLRVRGRTAPWWLTACYVAVIVPADFVMATGMLRGIKRRAESEPVLSGSWSRATATERAHESGCTGSRFGPSRGAGSFPDQPPSGPRRCSACSRPSGRPAGQTPPRDPTGRTSGVPAGPDSAQ